MRLEVATTACWCWSLLRCVALACGYAVFSRQPPYADIVGELPMSAKLTRWEVKQYGMDFSKLFEFQCGDTALREMLVQNWHLSELTAGGDGPTSFVERDPPAWWRPHKPISARMFCRADNKTETYISIWEFPDTNQLFVEYGRW
jgi:hypothetical protein